MSVLQMITVKLVDELALYGFNIVSDLHSMTIDHMTFTMMTPDFLSMKIALLADG